MAVDVWLRRPHSYFRDALASGYRRFVYDRESMSKARIDPIAYLREQTIGYQPTSELLLMGPQGAAHYNTFRPLTKPLAVYPVWVPGDSLDHLRAILENPVGDRAHEFQHLPTELQPVPGQNHIVVVRRLPDMRTGRSKALASEIALLIEDYPECKVHLSGNQSFSTLFDYGFHSVDFMPYDPTAISIHLPNGILLNSSNTESWAAYQDWISMLGFTFRQVANDRRARVAFNMRSVHWAADLYRSDLRIKMRFSPKMSEEEVPRVHFRPKTDNRIQSRNRVTTAKRSIAALRGRTDFMLCDECIFKPTCKLVRVNSVCIVKGSDTVALADAFGSRNADRIIDGLGKLLEMQADRAERAIEEEAISGEVNPDVTRQMNSLFKNGVSLAKLINPDLNGKGVNVNILNGAGSNASIVAGADPRQLVASAVRALENQGIKREEITDGMIEAMLTSMAKGGDKEPARAIEGQIVRKDAL